MVIGNITSRLQGEYMINKIQLAYIRIRDFFIELFCKHEWSDCFAKGDLIDDGYFERTFKVCIKCGKII